MVCDHELLVYKEEDYYSPTVKLKVSLIWDLEELGRKDTLLLYSHVNYSDESDTKVLFKYWDSRVKSKSRWIVNSNAEHAFYLNSLCKLSEDEIARYLDVGLETTHWIDLRVTNVDGKESKIEKTMENFLSGKVGEEDFRDMFLSNTMNFYISNDFSGNKWELSNYTSKRTCNVLFDLGEFVRNSRDFWLENYADVCGYKYPEYNMMSNLANILELAQLKSGGCLRKFVEFQ